MIVFADLCDMIFSVFCSMKKITRVFRAVSDAARQAQEFAKKLRKSTPLLCEKRATDEQIGLPGPAAKPLFPKKSWTGKAAPHQ